MDTLKVGALIKNARTKKGYTKGEGSKMKTKKVKSRIIQLEGHDPVSKNC